MGGLRLPDGDQREEMRKFLAEATGLHIDGLTFTKGSSGASMRCDYRDQGGFQRTKTISNPDARSWDEVEDLPVLMSELLTHGTTIQIDMMERSEGTGNA